MFRRVKARIEGSYNLTNLQLELDKSFEKLKKEGKKKKKKECKKPTLATCAPNL